MELLGGYEGEARNKQVWGTPHFYDKNIGDQWDQDTTGSGEKHIQTQAVLISMMIIMYLVSIGHQIKLNGTSME
ncbi:MAG: hypothetical protein ACLS85_03575 [Coprobacillus cateniformis]